jgi:hypothetical protein
MSIMLKRFLKYIFIKNVDQTKEELAIQEHGPRGLELYHKETCVFLQIIWIVIVSLVVALINLSFSEKINLAFKMISIWLIYMLVIVGIIITKSFAKKLLNIRKEIRKYV